MRVLDDRELHLPIDSVASLVEKLFVSLKTGHYNGLCQNIVHLAVPLSLISWLWFSGVRVVLKQLRRAFGIPDLSDSRRQPSLM